MNAQRKYDLACAFDEVLEWDRGNGGDRLPLTDFERTQLINDLVDAVEAEFNTIPVSSRVWIYRDWSGRELISFGGDEFDRRTVVVRLWKSTAIVFALWRFRDA